MIGDNAKAIIANTSKNVRVTRTLIISLSLDYVHEIDYLKKVPGVYKTTGSYSLRYSPNEISGKTKGKPYLLKIDMFDIIESCGHRVVDFTDLCQSKFKDFVPFLIKYAQLSEELFELARNNPTCDIPFQINVLQYVSDVKEKYKQEHNGEEIEKFIFVSEYELARRNYLEEEKQISRNNAKHPMIKGVVDK